MKIAHIVCVSAIALSGSVASDAKQPAAQEPAAAGAVRAAPTAAGCEPSVATLTRIANAEWAASHDSERVLAALDEAIGPGSDDPSEFIDHREGLLFTLTVPARLYRFRVSEAMLRQEPIARVTADETVVIEVQTTQIDAPNIEKVLVERNGTLVMPISNNLAPRAVGRRIGANDVLNSGTLRFPCSTFLPGQKVVITGVPTRGQRLVREFSNAELAGLTGQPLPPPPGRAADAGGASTSSTNASPKPPIPTGAIARCGDGQFVFVSTGKDTCRSNKGVAEWFVKP